MHTTFRRSGPNCWITKAKLRETLCSIVKQKARSGSDGICFSACVCAIFIITRAGTSSGCFDIVRVLPILRPPVRKIISRDQITSNLRPNEASNSTLSLSLSICSELRIDSSKRSPLRMGKGLNADSRSHKKNPCLVLRLYEQEFVNFVVHFCCCAGMRRRSHP
jgi:hypothetical protein